MKLKNFSRKTISTYLYYNHDFIKFCQKSPRDVTAKDIRLYLLNFLEKGKTSSTINLAHNALNFYYGRILKRKVKDVPFQKREQKTKILASQFEINRMHSVVRNPKHKLMISVLYASGVRISELVKIKISDLDLENRLLLVRQGKGMKDRSTILSYTVVEEIKRYLDQRPYKSEYLFASREGHVCPRTVEAIIKTALQKAKISKNITPHSLRHSFATHHMEQGTRTEYIQKMLGHKDIRTTRSYEQVTNRHLLDVKSPHDKMDSKT